MKRNKNEIRNIGLTLLIMVFVLVVMFAIVCAVKSICDERSTNNADSEIMQAISEKEQYQKGFVESQKIMAVQLIIEDMRSCGELTDNQYKRYSEAVETLLVEVSKTGKISERARKQFNEILEYIFEKEEYSGNLKKEELTLTEETIDVDGLIVGYL